MTWEKKRFCDLKVGDEFRFMASDPLCRVLNIGMGVKKILIGTAHHRYGAKSKQWVLYNAGKPERILQRLMLTDEVKDFIEKNAAEMTIKEICAHFNVKYDTVYKYCQRMGIKYKYQINNYEPAARGQHEVLPTSFVRPTAEYTNRSPYGLANK